MRDLCRGIDARLVDGAGDRERAVRVGRYRIELSMAEDEDSCAANRVSGLSVDNRAGRCAKCRVT